MKRRVKVHTVTLLSLFDMNMESFSRQNTEVTDEYNYDLSEFIDSYNDLSFLAKISMGQEMVKQKITSSDLETKFANFYKEGKLMHQVILVYMRMVSLM